MINSSRPSASVFPPPHLIITRNAHGAEEGEGAPGNEVAWVPGLPRSVRVLIMRRRQTFERTIKTRTERGRPGTEARNEASLFYVACIL